MQTAGAVGRPTRYGLVCDFQGATDERDDRGGGTRSFSLERTLLRLDQSAFLAGIEWQGGHLFADPQDAFCLPDLPTTLFRDRSGFPPDTVGQRQPGERRLPTGRPLCPPYGGSLREGAALRVDPCGKRRGRADSACDRACRREGGLECSGLRGRCKLPGAAVAIPTLVPRGLRGSQRPRLPAARERPRSPPAGRWPCAHGDPLCFYCPPLTSQDP